MVRKFWELNDTVHVYALSNLGELNLLTLLLTLCGLTSQKTHRGGPGLSGLVHKEAHPSFSYST